MEGGEEERGYFTQKSVKCDPHGKISYFHYHFKTPSLEVLELKFPKVQPQRAPEAMLSYTNLFVQFCIAVEGART